MGVATTMNGTPCATGRERWTRSATKVWLIDEALSAERGRTCSRRTGTNYQSASYVIINVGDALNAARTSRLLKKAVRW